MRAQIALQMLDKFGANADFRWLAASAPLRPEADAAAQALEQAGAEVKASNRMHSKTLAVDEKWISEGSFNWLSASRDEQSAFQRHEASMICEGPGVRDFIDAAWREVADSRAQN